jgi:hypothetical protein
LWRFALLLPVEALVGVIAEVDYSFGDAIGAPAVFMNASPNIEIRRCDALDVFIVTVTKDDIAATFMGSTDDPVDVATIYKNLTRQCAVPHS